MFEWKVCQAELNVIGASKKKREKQAALAMLKKRDACFTQKDIHPTIFTLANK